MWPRVWAGRLYVVGLLLDAAGFAASVGALRTVPLFVVESAIASSVAVTALLAVTFLGARLRSAEVVALAAVCLGLAGLATSATAGAADPLPPAGAALLLAAVGPVVLPVLLVRRLPPRRAAALLSVTAGLGFAGTGIAARVLVTPTRWSQAALDPVLWSLLAYGLVGLVAFGMALQRGSVTSTAAVTFTVETVVPSVAGLAWLGDRVRPGWEAAAALAFALTLGGCVRLARHATVAPQTPAPDARTPDTDALPR